MPKVFPSSNEYTPEILAGFMRYLKVSKSISNTQYSVYRKTLAAKFALDNQINLKTLIVDIFKASDDDFRWYLLRIGRPDLARDIDRFDKWRDVPVENIARVIKNERNKKNWRQPEFAKATGINLMTVSYIESGKRKKLRKKVVVAVCRYFKCQPIDIINNQDKDFEVTSKNVANFLRFQRRKRNINQSQLANILDCQQGIVSGLECEKYSKVSFEMLKKMCNAFKVNPEAIATFEYINEEPQVFDFGLILLSYRHRQNISKKRFSQEIKLDGFTIKRIEDNQRNSIGLSTKNKIYQFFNVSANEIIEHSEGARACNCPVLKLKP